MTRACLLLGLSVGLLLGCGDDDDGGDDPGDASLDGSMDGGDVMPPTGGTGGTGGTVTSGGTGGTTTPPLMCGETTCPAPPGQGLSDALAMFGLPLPPLFEGCCTDDDGCGLVVMTSDDSGVSSECVARPDSDPRCPDRDLLGVVQPSCCVEETGMCGVNAAQVGAPCTDYSGGLIGAFLAFDAIPCDGGDGGVDRDGG